jgi:hypothetical protein
VRIFCKENPGFNLAVERNIVAMRESNPEDEAQVKGFCELGFKGIAIRLLLAMEERILVLRLPHKPKHTHMFFQD